MLRDPRDLLTCQRNNGDRVDYCGTIPAWRQYFAPFVLQREKLDTLVVRFEDLIADASAQQQRVERFIGRSMSLPFTDFLKVDRQDFDTSTLCGLRPLDSSRVSRWRDPIHHERIRQILIEAPELPTALQQLGYETDDQWTHRYAQGQS